MSVRQSLLAILDQGPCYGNQLRVEFDRRTGSAWPINAGQVYRTLDRLERDRLVEKDDIAADGQIHYRITETGRAELATWLRTPVVRSPASRDELALKLALAPTLPGVDAAGIIRAQRDSALDTLRNLEGLRDRMGASSTQTLSELLVLDSRLAMVEAELTWLERAESRLAEAATRGQTVAMPLSTELPKRGRPAKPCSG